MTDALRKLLRERTGEFYLVAIILWLLPALALGVLGLMYLWQAGWFWWFSGALLLLTLASWCLRYVLFRPEEDLIDDVPHLDPRPDWSSQDNQVWRESVVHIEDAQLVNTSWEDIPGAMLDQLAFVARAYHGNDKDVEYAFTVPQLLLMLETWSREYRVQVIENVPFAQEIKISTVMSFSRTSKNLENIYRYGGPILRALRMGVNPVSGVMGEISTQFAMKYLGEFGGHMQGNMKIVLFEQVTQVAIDLYSGRLKFSEEELLALRRAQQKPEEVDIKPLSVIIVGQINAGKSSLVNALKQQCVAEIDLLPATMGFHYHHMVLADDLEIYLIDTPGIDGKLDTAKALLDEMVKADLLLWVSQANQPAKSLDKQLIEKWNAYFEQNLGRRKPPILLVTTHNDMLRPASDWHPPYDLEQSEDKKVDSMMQALRYTHQATGLSADSPSIPVSLLPGKNSFNLGALRELLLSISDEARSAQLNRERLDGDASSSMVSRVLHQSAGLVKFGVKLAVK